MGAFSLNVGEPLDLLLSKKQKLDYHNVNMEKKGVKEQPF
jgi:hypothetical protein